ncbi:MAG TPA: VWA domain-containing protein [Vicinamibacterales bacterium]|nr:VWA domain-containing protein [Vicinamibacterales bacterium]
MTTSRGSLRTVASAFALAACVLASLKGQTQAPVFKSNVDLVQLDVSVLDKNRRPVRGLSKTDFTVLEDGKPQDVAIFEAVDVPDPEPPPVAWMRDVTPDVTTNEQKVTRLWVIVVDDGLVPTETFPIKASKGIVRMIVDKLSANDLATIVFTADSRKAQDFTNDRTKLLATVEQFNPGFANWYSGNRGTAPGPVDPDWQFHTGALVTLRNVMESLIAMPNTRKALIWVSPGVPMDFTIVPTKAPVPRGADGTTMAPIQNQLKNIDIAKDVFQLSRETNIPFYPIQPCGLVSPIQVDRCGATYGALDFLQTVASNTGGHAIIQTNDFTPGIDSIFVENGSYYQIGYYPANGVADGRVRQLSVKVNRPDVEVRTKSTYVAPKAGAKPATSANARLAKAVSEPVPAAELPMRAALAPFAIPGKARLAAVTIALGVRQPVPESAAKERVTVATELEVVAFTTEGDNKGTQRSTAKVVLRPGAQGDADYEALSRIDLPPGRYRLRLAAYHEAAGKTGTVMADVLVPDFNRDVASMSGVVVSASPGRPSAPRDLFKEILPFVPTAQRAFTTSDKVTTLFDLYQNAGRGVGPATVAIRITDDHDVVVRSESQVLSADGFVSAKTSQAPMPIGGTIGGTKSIPTITPQAQAESGSSTIRAAEFQYTLPIERLVAGRYLLTFDVTIGQARLRRDVIFQVK